MIRNLFRGCFLVIVLMLIINAALCLATCDRGSLFHLFRLAVWVAVLVQTLVRWSAEKPPEEEVDK